jgi:hypothetical protein
LRLYHKVTVLVVIVGLSCLLKHAEVIPLEALIVSSRARVVDARRVLKDSRSRSGRAKTGNLYLDQLFNGSLPL